VVGWGTETDREVYACSDRHERKQSLHHVERCFLPDALASCAAFFFEECLMCRLLFCPG
jgi:hypothetical protein